MVSAPAAVLAGMGHAVPPPVSQQALWDGYFRDHYAGSPVARRLFARSGVHTRHAAVNPLVEDLSGWGTGARMRRYQAEAAPLAKDAVTTALDAAGLPATGAGLFTVVSCTGYATPGLDVTVARDLAMPADMQRLAIGHMGCYAALPGLAAAADFVVARRRPAVLLCAELTSLHLQPATDDREQMVAHALFSDAAAAVVLRPAPARGLTLLEVVSRTDARTADHMTWDVTDLGFRMGLSPHVPDVLAQHVADVTGELLHRHGLTVSDVDGWAVHPGGPRILDVVADRLRLPAAALNASRTVLAEHGNCSSATVLLVLERLTGTGLAPGSTVVALAFGPGLTLYAALLRAG